MNNISASKTKHDVQGTLTHAYTLVTDIGLETDAIFFSYVPKIYVSLVVYNK